jgi:hypothetical protein
MQQNGSSEERENQEDTPRFATPNVPLTVQKLNIQPTIYAEQQQAEGPQRHELHAKNNPIWRVI